MTITSVILSSNIIDFCERPFVDVPHMNAELVRLWNETVDVDDTVYYLGDLAMGKIDESLALVSQLNGHIILIPGNHDRCWKGKLAGEKLAKWEQKYLDAGISAIRHNPGPLNVQTHEYERTLDSYLYMCHFPFKGDSHDEDRFTGSRPDDFGQLLAHGHVHDQWLKNGRQVNVGVDVWGYKPVPLEVVVELAKEES